MSNPEYMTDDELTDEVAELVEAHESALWDLIGIVTNHAIDPESLADEEQQEVWRRARMIVGNWSTRGMEVEA